MMSECYADLHVHTTASDGTQSIVELACRAKECGLSTIAVTDHDTISNELTERVTRIGAIELITGVEIKAQFEAVPGELLGYFVQPDSPALQELFSLMQRARVERMIQMVEQCRNYTGLDITVSEVRGMAAGSLGRPHLAQLLVDKGAVPSMREAFNRLIARGRPCYVPLERPGFRKVIQAIHAAGGIAAVAHPCLMRVQDWEGFLHMLRVEGVEGMETFYPYELVLTGLRISQEALTALAKKHGFLLTGGSDDHGPASDKDTLGKVRIPCHVVEELKAACGLA